MAYNLNLTNGQPLIVGGLSDGNYDNTHTSLTLIGKNYANYGTFLNENFIYLLENFANNTSPANPLKGQLWWDTTNNILKVYSGSSWKISTGATSSPYSSPPGDLSTLGGDLWFDTTNSQLKVYSGTSWVTIGPQATPATGNTGSVPAIMTDTSGGNHIVIQFIINGIIYAIFSKEIFASALAGFSVIKAGLNFSTTASPSLALSSQDTAASPNTLVQRDSSGGIAVASLTSSAVTGTVFTGTSYNASSGFNGNLIGNVSATIINAGSVTGAGFLATSGYTGTILTAAQPNITSIGNIVNLNTNGITALSGFATYNGAEIATIGGTITFSSLNNTPVGNAIPATGGFTTVTVSNVAVPAANAVINLGQPGAYWGTIYGNTAQLGSLTAGNVRGTIGTFNSIVIPSGNITTGNLTVTTSILPSANLTANIGSTTQWFNNIYGTAVHAQYADLAERFHADAEYPAGTVVEMGGVNEITKVVAELSEKVFGVISTNAAYLMNSSAGNNETHPPIAMSGRVPVRAVGLITKGDRLVSAGNGLARSGNHSEITPWNVIGRSLVNKTDEGEQLIEAIVKINS